MAPGCTYDSAAVSVANLRGIAVAAWSSFWVDVAAPDAMLLSNGERTSAALDGLVEQALYDGDVRGEIASGQTPAGPAVEHAATPLAGHLRVVGRRD